MNRYNSPNRNQIASHERELCQQARQLRAEQKARYSLHECNRAFLTGMLFGIIFIVLLLAGCYFALRFGW